MIRLQKVLEQGEAWENIFLKSALTPNTDNTRPSSIILYYPPAKINPFQDALYCRAEHFSYMAVPIVDVKFLRDIDWPYGVILHIHWLGGVLKRAESEDQAYQLLNEFVEELTEIRRRGITLIWTVHNVIPHQTKFLNAEVKLRNSVSALADKIHVLTQSTMEAVRPVFELDVGKVFHTPHPAYNNYYLKGVDRNLARAELGWDKNAFYFLFFGGLERYKGVEKLIADFKTICEEHGEMNPRLAIVGPPTNPLYTRELCDAIGSEDTAVFFSPRAIRDSEVHFYFSACNAVVMPYDHSLNSGVALLAANFERGIIAPKVGAIAEIWADKGDLLYEPNDDSGLLLAMKRAFTTRFNKSFFSTVQKSHDAATVSNDFFRHLRIDHPIGRIE